MAEACLRLGLEVRLITVFGGDPEGERMEADCRAKGMDTGWSLRWKGPSARYLCALDADGSLVGAVADMEALDALVPGHLESAAKDLDKAFCIVADTNIPATSLAWLCRRYGRLGGTLKDATRPLLFLDTVSEAKAVKALGLFGEFDCVKPNMGEALIMAAKRWPPETPGDAGTSTGGPSVVNPASCAPSRAASEPRRRTCAPTAPAWSTSTTPSPVSVASTFAFGPKIAHVRADSRSVSSGEPCAASRSGNSAAPATAPACLSKSRRVG